MIELISVHLPKTAGTSFRKILQSHFGWRLLVLYGGFGSPGHFQKRLLRRPWIRAVHGHFPVKMFHDLNPTAKTVIWLRQPVERIISYYHFWLDLKPHGNLVHNRFLVEKPGLVEFAKQRRTEVSDYLSDYRLKDFDFVGTLDHFDDDLERFGRWLSGQAIRQSADPFSTLLRLSYALGRRTPQANRSRKRAPISAEIREELALILEEEMKIYSSAVNHRNAGRTAQGPDE